MDLDFIRTRASGLSREAWADRLVETAEEPAHDTPAMPPVEVQKLTNLQSGRQTMSGAAGWYHAFSALLEANEVVIDKDHQLLDIGVGWGRMLRFLLHDLPVENMTGVEVSPALVAACKETLPGGEFVLIEPKDPLPFEDASFDFVINNSLFSHLSPEQHLHTLDQITRVTRPGGYVVSTVLSRRHVLKSLVENPTPGPPWSQVEDPAALLASVDAGEFVFMQTRQGRMADYGMAVVPDAWIMKNWSSRLEVLDFDHEAPGQSLVLARKPLSTWPPNDRGQTSPRPRRRGTASRTR
jgi:SAM-dependent methyltransferase